MRVELGGIRIKRTQAITGLIIVVVLLVSLQTTIPVTSSEYGPSANGTKAGDRVYVDTSDAYISASPHTLAADGYVYLNITSKRFGDNIDLCFGFNNSLAYPKSLEIFDPRNVTTSHEFNLTPFRDSPGCRVEYNSSKQIGTTVYDGYYWVYRNDTIFREVPVNFTSMTSNETRLLKGKQPIGWNWTSIYSQHYDLGSLETGMFYWSITETLNWTTLCGNLSSSKQAQSFLGMDKWYLGSVSFEQGKEYYLRVWLTVVPTLDDVTHEFLVAFKPHLQSFQAALANGLFCYLDPWFNDGWTYRKSHVITSASGAETGYQVWIVVHNYAGTDSGNHVYVSCRSDFGDVRFTSADGVTLLDYWIDATAGDDQLINYWNSKAFWVKIPGNLSSANQTIYIYYGNPNTCTSTSNGSATFEFFDDFSGSSLDSSKWGSVSGGGSLSVSNGELGIIKSSATYAAYPTVYSLSSFPVLGRSFVARLYDWGYYDTISVGFTVRNPLNNTPASNRYSSATHKTNYYEEWGVSLEDYYCSLDTDGSACDYSSDLTWDQILLRKELKHSSSYNAWKFNNEVGGSYSAKSFGSSDVVYLLFGVSSNGQAGTGVYHEYVDWVFARKFVNPEPGHGGWGEAQSIGSWYDSSWHYRKCHIIEPSEGAGTDYQVRINGHYFNGTDNGADVYFGGKCKGGFGDIRFTPMDGK